MRDKLPRPSCTLPTCLTGSVFDAETDRRKIPTIMATAPQSHSSSPADGPGAGKDAEIVVFITRHDGQCADCGEAFFRGALIRVENQRTLCLDCADLGHLEFLPRGDVAITRRASKHSPLRAVVVEWSRTRKRYERQGILVTGQAIRTAEAESLADADVRARTRERAAARREADEPAFLASITAALRTQFPGCPAAEAATIAAWACTKHSGRVGRTAAAKALDPAPLRLAVIAHLRHEHTPYDRLLMRHGDRRLAREEVRPQIDEILRRWETPRPTDSNQSAP
jgi:hypothetical protein